MKRLPWAPQGLEIGPGPRAPLGTVGWSCLACLVQSHHWRRRECTQLRRDPLARPPQPALTCSCGMGGLRACPPRMARACNLRGEERRGFSLEGAGTREQERGFGKGARPTTLSAVGSLTQIEDSELRERRHRQRPRLRAGRRGLLWGHRDTLRPRSPEGRARLPSDGGGREGRQPVPSDRARGHSGPVRFSFPYFSASRSLPRFS